MNGENGILVFPEAGGRSYSGGIDPTLLLALSGNGGFGGMNNPFWMMFMLPFIYPFFGSMLGGNGWFGGGFGGNNNGVGYLANQLNNDAGRDLILQAINGRADAIAQLAQLLNTSISTVQNGINSLNTTLVTMDGNVKLTGAQIINAIQSGDAALAQQFAQCCCENRLAICQQTNALETQASQNHAASQAAIAAHDANVRLQLAQLDGSDKLAICQQTNTLQNQAERDTNSILNAIAGQNTLITKEFCDLKERELQSKIDVQSDIITQLRGQISNDAQTKQFSDAINALNEKIALLAAKQPNTVPVQYPNLVAANATPYVGQSYPYGNGFGGGIVF